MFLQGKTTFLRTVTRSRFKFFDIDEQQSTVITTSCLTTKNILFFIAKRSSYRHMLAVQDFQWRFDTGFAEVPIVRPVVFLQHANQLRYVDVVVIVEMTKPSSK